MTRLWAKQMTNRGSVPFMGERLVTPPKRLDWLCGPPKLLYCLIGGGGGVLLCGKEAWVRPLTAI